MYAPEVVVRQFASGGFFKAGYMDALWIYPTKYVADGAILAAGVHALEHEEQLLAAVDEETLLQIREALM